MAVYNFGCQCSGQMDAGAFNSVLESYRTDAQQTNSPISIYNPESKDIQLARSLANEMINVSGAEVRVFLRTENADYDVVWDEDPDPTYWTPILIKAFFKPEPIQTELTKWGADTKNRTEVMFSHQQLFTEVGERMLRAGDVIQLPFNAVAINPRNFRVLNATPSGNFRYTWLYWSCQVETLTADVAVRPENDMLLNDEPIRTGGVYRESI
jgi:hypothetical protein